MIQTEREYAEALFTLAVEENAVEEFLDSLVTLKQLFDENPDYIEFLNSPAIPLGERTASIDEAFDGKMPQYVVSFIKVLCENGKMRTTNMVLQDYVQLMELILAILK